MAYAVQGSHTGSRGSYRCSGRQSCISIEAASSCHGDSQEVWVLALGYCHMLAPCTAPHLWTRSIRLSSLLGTLDAKSLDQQLRGNIMGYGFV